MSARSVETSICSPSISDGEVDWYLVADGQVLTPTPNQSWKSDEVSGAKKITLTAVIVGGKQPCLMISDMNVDEGTVLKLEVKLQGMS